MQTMAVGDHLRDFCRTVSSHIADRQALLRPKERLSPHVQTCPRSPHEENLHKQAVQATHLGVGRLTGESVLTRHKSSSTVPLKEAGRIW